MPRSMSRDMTKSAGTTAAQQSARTHHGPVRARQRKRNRVAVRSSSGSRMKAHVQLIHAPPARQLNGRWEVDRRTRCAGAYSRWTTKPHSVLGGPSGMKSPTSRLCHSGTMRSTLARLAGNSSRSTQRAVYHPQVMIGLRLNWDPQRVRNAKLVAPVDAHAHSRGRDRQLTEEGQ